MNRLRRILAPTDLSENSRAGLSYAFSSAEDCQAEVIILHVADEWQAWQALSDEMAFVTSNTYKWTVDRIINEATLDLNRFLEASPRRSSERHPAQSFLYVRGRCCPPWRGRQMPSIDQALLGSGA